MASRINIESSLWSDDRFVKLCIRLGDEAKAIGNLVMAWKLAQKYWCPNRNPIPLPEFQRAGICREMIDCGLADLRDDGVYIRGAEEHFSWWFRRSKAGVKSAESRKQKFGSAQPSPRTLFDDTPNNVEHCPNSPEPLTLSLSLPLTQNTKTPLRGVARVAPQPRPKNEEGLKVRELIAAYCEAFKSRYGENPVIDGKTQGLARQMARHVPLEKAKQLVQVYVQMQDSWFVTKHHDFATFAQNISKVAVAAARGENRKTADTTDWNKVFQGGGNNDERALQAPAREAREPVA